MVEEGCDDVAVQAMQFGVIFWTSEDFQICSVRLEGMDRSVITLEIIIN